MRERKCDIAGTRRNKANSVSKSNVHTRKFQLVNLQYRKLWWPEGNCFVRIRISTRTLKTIKKNGLNATAKKHDIDLSKYMIKMDTPKGTIPNPPLQYGEVKMKFRTAKKVKTPLLLGLKRAGESRIPVIPLADRLSSVADSNDDMDESFGALMDELEE